MGFNLTNTVSSTAVFLQGILSFFSPCVLPLIPVYLSYLSGGISQTDPKIRRRKLLVSTLCFVVGISFAFFVLGLGVSAIGKFFSGSSKIFAFAGGILLIFLGLFQLGVFGQKTLHREFRLPFKMSGTINPLTALLLGFTFSFAWTPCVGPALTSVLLMAGSADSSSLGFFYIFLYTIGFVIPFLALGFFADSLVGWLQKSKKALVWTTRVGAVLLILMGGLLLSGWVTSDTFQDGVIGTGSAPSSNTSNSPTENSDKQDPNSRPSIPAIDFSLKDQYGNTHTLSDYKGKVVFLNFWADWCGYCIKEMPDIQQLYLDHKENTEDVVILGITYGMTQESMAKFFEDKGFTYPTLLDTNQSIFAAYGASALPTTYMIDKDGNIFGYLDGMMSREIMDSIIQQTLDAEKEKEATISSQSSAESSSSETESSSQQTASPSSNP